MKWIPRNTSPQTVKRYGVSLGQLRPFLEGKKLSEIDGRLVAEIIRAREARGVSNATIKRDLGALSSVMNFAIDQSWIEANPVLPRLKRVKEVRAVIDLPRRADIDMVVELAPGMIRSLIEVAIATGAREAELVQAKREAIDFERRQMTIVYGKRGKRRTFDLRPFDGIRLIQALPSYVGSPLLFWHGAGESYKNFASQFAAIVARTATWAEANGVDFRRFHFHALRHLHAVEWLRSGRSLEELCHRLGHDSIKTTEGYCQGGRWGGHLTHEQEQAARAARPGSVPAAQAARRIG